ncbi:hypothetical protein SAMN04488095_0397 [Jannaschia pohangensis]|uniref:Membrane protein YjdF n=1 Tax=Jannaschia pohangensis TaxID=390807 RepID=A0A1I3GZY4_9RHOB|nr:hypothetical protein SAMN04488095_0397 [Jannaschia pohangensis]
MASQPFGNGGKLHPAMATQKAQVNGGDDQGAAADVEACDQRTARLQPRQVHHIGPELPTPRPQKDRIAVPAERAAVADCDRLPPGTRKQGHGQGRGTPPQPFVRLLQGQNIRTDVVGHPKDPSRVTPPVKPDGLPDVVAGQPDQPGRLRRKVIIGVCVAFVVLAVCALVFDRPILAAVSVLSLILTLAPLILAARLRIVLPLPFVLALATFLAASLLLGEAFDLYERVWWWDIALHTVAATGLGMAGFLFVLMLFEGDRFAAPIWALTLIAACVAITLGVLWELFEFTMDSVFGLRMQKSGLADTMGDLWADLVGATLGALTGAVYLTGRKLGFATTLMSQFVRINGRFFRKRK